jgi:hypothetical protein
MAITATGKAAEQAQENLRTRQIENPFITQQRATIGAVPTTRNVSYGGQTFNVPLSGMEQIKAIANAPKTITQEGGQLVRAQNQSALEAASKAVGDVKYQSPEQAASYIKGLQESLGLKGPEDASDATRKAAFSQLNREAYMGSLRDAANLSAQGQERGSRSQALSVLRGTELAGKKAQTEADIQQERARQMADYERMLFGAAQQQGGALSQFEAQRAQSALSAQQALTDDEWRRRMAAYEAALAQQQQANTADLAAIQKRQANVGAGLGFVGDLLGAGAQVGGAAIGKP